MTKCRNCGKEHDGAFCPYCGTRAEEGAVCPKCGAEIEEGAVFCRHCGNRISTDEQQKSVVIKNETKRDLDFSARMNYYMVGKRSRIMLFISSLVLILLGGGIVCAVEILTSSSGEYDFSVGGFLILLGILFFIFALMHKSTMRKAIQKNMQGKEATNLYTFTEEGYDVATKISDGTMGKTWGNYGSFTEVKEFTDMWLLYVNGMTVFPVSKAGMTKGTAEELSELFKRTTGVRYKVCYKVK